MPKNPELAWNAMEQRWRTLFSLLSQGGEVPPSLRLRTEGLMEAQVLMGLADQASVQDALEICYQDVTGEALRGDWRELFPFPQIPGFGRRAPVFPSTPD